MLEVAVRDVGEEVDRRLEVRRVEEAPAAVQEDLVPGVAVGADRAVLFFEDDDPAIDMRELARRQQYAIKRKNR